MSAPRQVLRGSSHDGPRRVWNQSLPSFIRFEGTRRSSVPQVVFIRGRPYCKYNVGSTNIFSSVEVVSPQWWCGGDERHLHVRAPAQASAPQAMRKRPRHARQGAPSKTQADLWAPGRLHVKPRRPEHCCTSQVAILCDQLLRRGRLWTPAEGTAVRVQYRTDIPKAAG